jgi:hypothetical protein
MEIASGVGIVVVKLIFIIKLEVHQCTFIHFPSKDDINKQNEDSPELVEKDPGKCESCS